jgi:class 3 adenylate cyclase
MKGGSYEKVRIIVAFGDIEGFTGFWEEVTNDDEELLPYLRGFDDIVDQVEKESGHSFTDTGDGFMVVLELNGQRTCTVALSLLSALHRLVAKMQEMHLKIPHPKPDGFRVVLASGYVVRTARKNGRRSYRGRHINLAHNLLDLARGQGVVCHGSFKALIPEREAKEAGILFTPLKAPGRIPWSVPRKDAISLFRMETWK